MSKSEAKPDGSGAQYPLRKMLPAAYYVDEQVFAEEMERFFFQKWICVGRSEEIGTPGQYLVKQVGRESVILVRAEDGRARAHFNVCRHRGTRLCDSSHGQFSGRIQCPYHAWTYSYSGELLAAPGMKEVNGFAVADYPLKAVALEEWDGHLFLNFSGTAGATLEEQLEKLPALFANWKMGDLRMAHRITYDIKANWKLIIQNYSECLHCPIIHPALQKLSHYLSGENEPPNPLYLGGRMVLRDGVNTMTLEGTTTRKPFPGLTEEEKRHVYYYSLVPNLLLSLHPDYMMTHTLWPKSAGVTEVICEFHFHPEEIARDGFDPADAVEFWDLTNRQDWHVSELSQLGIGSRSYEPGVYSPRESLLSGLDDIVR